MKLVTRLHGNVQVLELWGRFDAHMAPLVETWQDNAKTPYAVINLAGVTFIDSRALAALVRGMKHFRHEGGELRLCCLQQPVRIILELTKMNREFKVHDTEQKAIDAFAIDQHVEQ